MSKNWITVEQPVVTDNSKVRYPLSCSPTLQRYFSREQMFVSYGLNLEGVPESILLIPIVATLAPIAWVLNVELRIRTLDAAFVEALESVRRTLPKIHPGVEWRGEVRVDRLVELLTANRSNGAAVLFSGGVDSLATFFSRKKERQRIVSVWGADVGMHESRFWEDIASEQRSFAQQWNAEIFFVRTNFRTFFRPYRLRKKYFPSYSNWYSAIQQGLGLTAICAPLAYIHSMAYVYIASSANNQFLQSWGSHPEIDNQVRWASTRVVHEGLNLTRQQKLEFIARHVRGANPPVLIRVCWGRSHNCGRCEKCVRTIIGLLLAGLDPNDHGFKFSATDLTQIRRRLETSSLGLRPIHKGFWIDIQDHARQKPTVIVPGCGSFIAWLSEAPADLFAGNERLPWRQVIGQFLMSRPEPVGTWLRRILRHPFP
jgi:hypothetical protein